MWEDIVTNYPIFSIEDPLDEEDWEGWEKITAALGDKIRLVGDDLFVTNVTRLKKGIDEKCANAILIKPNQIGSVMETIEAVRMAQSQELYRHNDTSFGRNGRHHNSRPCRCPKHRLYQNRSTLPW